MQKILCMILALGMLMLWGCGRTQNTPAQKTEPSAQTANTSVPTTIPETQGESEPTTVPTTLPTEPPTEPPAEPTTEPPTDPPEPPAPVHSALYLPDVTVEDMIAYFNEVVLNMEYTTGSGDMTLVQKWLVPIRYQIFGTPTEEDLQVLEALFAELNQVPGFPGISKVQDYEAGNLTISFLNEDDFQLAFSDFLGGELADGAVQFWYYTDSNDIYSGRVGYRTDIDQETRNSVLPEEIINLLGFNDSVLREDSIVYQYSSTVLELSDVDWVLLQLLYDPAIQCGMNAEECETVIRSLYY